MNVITAILALFLMACVLSSLVTITLLLLALRRAIRAHIGGDMTMTALSTLSAMCLCVKIYKDMMRIKPYDALIHLPSLALINADTAISVLAVPFGQMISTGELSVGLQDEEYED